jgi:hypothetical protein
MMMRFRGGGVGHMSTRAATDVFKTDRDDLDKQSRQARREASNVEDEEETGDEEMNGNESVRPPNIDDIETIIEGANVEDEVEIDQEGELSESELIDYGYEPEIESDEDEDEDEEEPEEGEDRDVGEEDDITIDELAVLGYADY